MVVVVALLALVSSVVGQDLSSCCAALRVESSAEATEHQSNRLGDYRFIICSLSFQNIWLI